MAEDRKSLKMPFLLRVIAQHVRAIKISFRQLSLSIPSTLMTFAVIGIVLALPMGLFIFLKNIQTAEHNIHNSAQISLYLKQQIPDSDLNNLLRILHNDKTIQQVQYISPQAGLKEFEKSAGFNQVLKNLKENPLPGVVVIQPATWIQNALQIKQLLARVQSLPYVNQAQLDMHWLQRLNAILMVAHRLLYAIVIIFFLAVLLIINHTIRLMTQNHQDEIKVIQLLGGTNQFIRRPFLYSGLIYGLAGGIIAWFLIDGLMWFLQSPITTLANLYGTNFNVEGLNLHTTSMLLITSMLLGYIGSWFATNRYIQEIGK